MPNVETACPLNVCAQDYDTTVGMLRALPHWDGGGWCWALGRFVGLTCGCSLGVVSVHNHAQPIKPTHEPHNCTIIGRNHIMFSTRDRPPWRCDRAVVASGGTWLASYREGLDVAFPLFSPHFQDRTPHTPLHPWDLPNATRVEAKGACSVWLV